MPLPTVNVTSAGPTQINTLQDAGQNTMVNSHPVVVASNQSAIPVSAASLPLPAGAALEAGGNLATIVTEAGALTETAPATDTASSGLNGRLQRIAQRLTTLIGLYPASLGQKTMAGSLAVTVASDQSAVPVSGTVTANAGTNLNTSALALETGGNLAAVAAGFVAQGSTTPGQKGNLELGAVTTAAPSYTTGQTSPLSLDTTGALRVNVTAGGAAGGTSSSFGVAFPAAGTAVGAKNGANMVNLTADGSGNLNVNVAAGGAAGGTSSSFGSADPASGTAAGFSDGTNMREARVFDADSGAGTQYVLGVGLRKIASGGSVEAGTSSDPLRVDPTGTTTQPVSLAAGSALAGKVGIDQTTIGTTNGVTEVGSGSWTVSQVSVTNAATQLVAARAGRAGVVVTNHGTTALFLGGPGVTTANGTLLPGVVGASKTIPFTGSIFGIVAAGTQTAGVEDIF